MRFLNNLSISRKMPIIMVFLVVVSAVVSGVLSGTQQKRDLIEHAGEALEAAADNRMRQLEMAMMRSGADLTNFASQETTTKYLGGFQSGVSVLGVDAESRLREAFVDANPFPDAREQLIEPEVTGLWAYAGPHKAMHPAALNMIQTFGYRDLFLIDTDGRVLYSVLKGKAFATNLATGPYAQGPLGKLYGLMAGAGDKALDRVFSVPLDRFSADDGRPAVFIGQAVATAEGEVAGYAVIRFRETLLSEIVNRNSGLGETGVSYLVARDRTARTTSRFDDDFQVFDSLADRPQVSAALDGVTGTAFGPGRNGQRALIHYQPFTVAGLDWALVTEMDEREVLSSLWALYRLMAVQQGLAILGVSLIAFLFSSSLAKPLRRVSDAMSRIAERHYETEVPDVERKDEIGQIAERLDEFRVALVKSERANFEGNFRSAAFANSRSAIMMSGKDHKIMHVNASLRAILSRYAEVFEEHVDDFDEDKIIGRSMHDFHSPEARERAAKALADPDNLPFSTENGFGDVRIALNISAVRDDQGEHIGYVTEWSDVSEGYMNNALLKTMDANQVKAEFAPDGDFLRANDMFAATMEYTGDPSEDLGNIRDLSVVFADTFDKIERGEAVFGRFEIPRRDGSVAMIDGSFAPVMDAGGTLLRVVLVGNDVTEATLAMQESEAKRIEMQDNQTRVVDGLRRGL
ncbi:MAG TPA: chemotaxis protein, partial [Maritimibacter sp.]|nr:chemotaxis protein [Maritimibacter sp.]